MLISGEKTSTKDLAGFRTDIKNLFDTWKAAPWNLAENIFPAEFLTALRKIGVLDALLSREEGGLDLCRTPQAGLVLMTLLRRTGYVSLSLGRCLEGHVNVVRLVELYGAPEQRHAFARHLQSGILAGIWVTDGTPPVTIRQENGHYRLAGLKGLPVASGTSVSL